MSFNDREQAFEAQFSEELKSNFRIEARASKLIGYWAADKMGLDEVARESYSKEVITANLDEPGYNDVKRKITKDFAARNVHFTEDELDLAIQKAIVEAEKQLKPV